MGRGRWTFTLGGLLVVVGVCACFFYWARPFIPLSLAGSPWALFALLPFGFLIFAISLSRVVDLYIKRVESDRVSRNTVEESSAPENHE